MVLYIGMAAFITAVLYRFVLPGSKSAKIITSATLTEAIDIAELSTAEFTYRGIAEVYGDKDKTKVHTET